MRGKRGSEVVVRALGGVVAVKSYPERTCAWLTPAQARELAEALFEVAEEIDPGK